MFCFLAAIKILGEYSVNLYQSSIGYTNSFPEVFVEKAFLTTSKNSQENTGVRVSKNEKLLRTPC